VATRLYLKGGRAKVEIALAKGKKLYDKREVISAARATGSWPGR
jgi:SsrA-binding protein